MKTCIKTVFISLGISFAFTMLQDSLKTAYLSGFLRQNLISLLIALIAINSGTLGIVLTKIRELTDKRGDVECFKETRKQMILSIKEQLFLVVFGTLLLMTEESKLVKDLPNGSLVVRVLLGSVFAYSMLILYDTAKSVFAILDFDSNKK